MRESSTAAVPPIRVQAEVRVRDQVMRYRRSGGGLPVVVLGSPGEPEPLWPGLHEALSSRFRLIVPELPRCDSDVAAWLSAFLEGLGSTEVRVIASSEFCVPALELALGDLDRIARVVLVPVGEAGESGLDGRVAAIARRAEVPLLVVPSGSPAAEAIPLVVGFCEDGRGKGGEPY